VRLQRCWRLQTTYPGCKNLCLQVVQMQHVLLPGMISASINLACGCASGSLHKPTTQSRVRASCPELVVCCCCCWYARLHWRP
jgi:hypothetical protein